jgi:hypothetical protein
LPGDASAQRPLRRGLSSSVSRKAYTKLTLSRSKKHKEEAVQHHNSDAVLEKLVSPCLLDATSTAEPFTTSSVYYDGEWMVLQANEFTKWLNSLLTPPEELNSTTALTKGCKHNIRQEQFPFLLAKYEAYHLQSDVVRITLNGICFVIQNYTSKYVASVNPSLDYFELCYCLK